MVGLTSHGHLEIGAYEKCNFPPYLLSFKAEDSNIIIGLIWSGPFQNGKAAEWTKNIWNLNLSTLDTT